MIFFPGADKRTDVYLCHMLRHDGYYVSEAQIHLRNDGGRRIEEEYFLLYRFFQDGTWICKTAPIAEFGFEAFLSGLDLDAIRQHPDEDEPMLPNRELLYQSGTYTYSEGTVFIEWKNSNVQEEPLHWKFQVVNENRLETAFGEYSLKFVSADFAV